MSEQTNDSSDEPVGAFDEQYAFGPNFFLASLSAFVRDRCPDPDEHLPSVEIHLHDGDVLQLCHIIGLAPHWVALAIFDGEGSDHRPPPMATELIPYMWITRVGIRSLRREMAHLGFDAHAQVHHLCVDDHGRSAENAFGAAMLKNPAKQPGRKTGSMPGKERKR